MHLSRLVANGVDIRTVADRAGHSDTVLMMRLYAHALAAQRKRAAIPLDLLSGWRLAGRESGGDVAEGTLVVQPP